MKKLPTVIKILILTNKHSNILKINEQIFIKIFNQVMKQKYKMKILLLKNNKTKIMNSPKINNYNKHSIQIIYKIINQVQYNYKHIIKLINKQLANKITI